MSPVPGDAASARLSRVLEAGGIEPTPERVQRLADLMQWSVDQVILASLPRRRPPAPKPRGRPKNRNMIQLVANLAWFWRDETGKLPTLTYSADADAHSGLFIEFASALIGELAGDTPALGDELARSDVKVDPKPLRAFEYDLKRVHATPSRIRDWLRAARVSSTGRRLTLKRVEDPRVPERWRGRKRRR